MYKPSFIKGSKGDKPDRVGVGAGLAIGTSLGTALVLKHFCISLYTVVVLSVGQRLYFPLYSLMYSQNSVIGFLKTD